MVELVNPVANATTDSGLAGEIITLIEARCPGVNRGNLEDIDRAVDATVAVLSSVLAIAEQLYGMRCKEQMLLLVNERIDRYSTQIARLTGA
jgi:hypothetical protein